MLENPVSEGVLDKIMAGAPGYDKAKGAAGGGKGEEQGDVGADVQAKDDLNDVDPEEIKKAAQEQGAGNEAEKLQDELEKEKQEKETRDAQRQKELNPMIKQANQNLRHISTDAMSIAAGHENLAGNIEDLSDQQTELDDIIDQIGRLLS